MVCLDFPELDSLAAVGPLVCFAVVLGVCPDPEDGVLGTEVPGGAVTGAIVALILNGFPSLLHNKQNYLLKGQEILNNVLLKHLM